MNWQPIETAPKDGTTIDLWGMGERFTDAEWRLPECGQDPVPGWCLFEWHTTYEFPMWAKIDTPVTHWMQITEPSE